MSIAIQVICRFLTVLIVLMFGVLVAAVISVWALLQVLDETSRVLLAVL